MSNNDLVGFVGPAQHLARALAADLSSFREDCLNWSARPFAHYGPFGAIGNDLLRQVVELIKQRNTRAGLNPLAQAQFQSIARKIATAAQQLSPDDFSNTHGFKGDALLSLTASRLKDKVILPLFTDIHPTPRPPSHNAWTSPPSYLPAPPKRRPVLTVIQGGLGPGTD